MGSRGIDDEEVLRREAHILQWGLTCRVASLRRDGNWSGLDLEPLPGFVHLVADEVYAGYVERGEPYHVSLGWDVSETLLDALARRWGGPRAGLGGRPLLAQPRGRAGLAGPRRRR